jgi:gliding motility-associated-like protein
MFDGSTWHLFFVNKTNHSVSRLDMGMALSLPVLPLVPTVVMGGAINLPFNNPRDISIIKDCSNYYGYVTNEALSTLTVLNFGTTLTGIPTATNMGNFAGFNAAGYLTRFIRDKDNVFAFTANAGDNSISRLEYNSCVASSIPNYYEMTPPPITYTTPGSYNVYFAADEGLPTMNVSCKLITVLPVPIIELTNDTLICQRDSLLLVANGLNLASVQWDPVYNGRPPFDTTSIYVAPQEDYTYNVHLEFLASGGCAYDRAVHVTVGKVTADAGPDRFIADGAISVLGGPKMSYGTDYQYDWKPQLWLDQFWVANPICKPVLANPLNDAQQYIVTVTDTSTQCTHKDTMWVYTECTQINMPNVFNTQSDIPINRKFGVLNTKLAKLEYFRIYNRWGNLVFDTNDLNKSWDGTQNNIELPSDNYVWIIDGYCDNGLRVRKQGTVLLVK